MATFFERYQAGEYEQVWVDLVALGPQVYQEPYFSDAKAVANETMRRVRHNIELIVQRLKDLQFDFVRPDAMISPPDPELIGNLDAFEQEIGPIPMSIRAWCEIVGSVDLMGTYPGLSYYHSMAEIDSVLGKALSQGKLDKLDLQTLVGTMVISGGSPALDDARMTKMQDSLNAMISNLQKGMAASPLFGGANFEKITRDVQKRGEKKPRYSIAGEDQVMSDPLSFDMGEINIDYYNEWRESQKEGEVDLEDPFSVSIAPDFEHKSNISGAGGYDVALPNPAADCELLYESHHTTFVNYLRLSFRWGGFLGLESAKNRSDDVLAQLTDGLLPI